MSNLLVVGKVLVYINFFSPYRYRLRDLLVVAQTSKNFEKIRNEIIQTLTEEKVETKTDKFYQRADCR